MSLLSLSLSTAMIVNQCRGERGGEDLKAIRMCSQSE